MTLHQNLKNDIFVDQERLNAFNLRMTYHFSADIPIPWITRSVIEALFDLEPIRSFQEKDDNPSALCWIGSNCDAHNGRQLYLKELFKHIHTDSFGECLRSKTNHVVPPKPQSLTETISRYKFYIVIENAICNGYISEKLENAIISTVIPVVFMVDGVPEYDRLMPPHSYINAADFHSAFDLAEYLKFIGSDQKRYASYFWFKSNEQEKERTLSRFPFKSFNDESLQNQWCNAAETVYNYKLRNVSKVVSADHSCSKKGVMLNYLR